MLYCFSLRTPLALSWLRTCGTAALGPSQSDTALELNWTHNSWLFYCHIHKNTNIKRLQKYGGNYRMANKVWTLPFPEKKEKNLLHNIKKNTYKKLNCLRSAASLLIHWKDATCHLVICEWHLPMCANVPSREGVASWSESTFIILITQLCRCVKSTDMRKAN